MTFYKKKPVVIEAVLWTGHNHKDIDRFVDTEDLSVKDHNLLIHTLEGIMQAKPGDYIIKGVQGEFYPCKPDIFEATYEEVV